MHHDVRLVTVTSAYHSGHRLAVCTFMSDWLLSLLRTTTVSDQQCALRCQTGYCHFCIPQRSEISSVHYNVRLVTVTSAYHSGHRLAACTFMSDWLLSLLHTTTVLDQQCALRCQTGYCHFCIPLRSEISSVHYDGRLVTVTSAHYSGHRLAVCTFMSDWLLSLLHTTAVLDQQCALRWQIGYCHFCTPQRS